MFFSGKNFSNFLIDLQYILNLNKFNLFRGLVMPSRACASYSSKPLLGLQQVATVLD